ncbi:MAG: hypothetical protein Q8N83_12940 [Ignavibacteria bacterium]|nr:hypothetical protein [Ignavibacteria bacterium]
MFYLLAFLFCFIQTSHKISIENQWIRNAGKGANKAFFADVKKISTAADTQYKVSSPLARLV